MKKTTVTTTPLTLRIRPEQKEALTRLAEAENRSLANFALQAIEDRLALEEEKHQAIKQGIVAAERGELLSLENVFERINQWGTPGNNASL
jgi:predicted transcriptional regulator